MLSINGSVEKNSSLRMVTFTNVSQMNPPSCFNASAEIDSHKSLVQNIDYIVTGPLLVIVIIIGLTTNAFCLTVFARRFRAVRIYFYLLVLAIWDVSLVIGAFFMLALPTVLYGRIKLYGEYSQAFPFFYFLSNVARNGCVWIVVALALERYFALCHPYKFIEWNTEKRVYTLLSLVSCCALIYGLPRFFELKTLECQHPVTSSLLPILRATELRKSVIYWFTYRVAGGFLFYSVGPFLLLSVLTIRISFEIGRKSSQMQRQPSTKRKSGRRESQFLRFIGRIEQDDTEDGGGKQGVNHWMHVAVITKFLIFHCMPTVLDIIGSIDAGLLHSPAGTLAGHISNLLVVLNSSCNFFIYLRTSSHFKRDLTDCLHRRKPPKTFFL